MNKKMKNTLLIGFVILLVSACGQAGIASTPAVQEPGQTAQVVIESPAGPVITPSAVVGDLDAPAGWITASHAIQSCEVHLSYPAEMQVTDQDANSRLLGYIPEDPDNVAWNFIYVSIIHKGAQGSNEEYIYNYSPMVEDLLLDLKVGESAAVHDNPQIASWYTYQRLPDTIISGQTALAYENVMPWEFPAGTKEIRYYVSVNDCLYQIGGYLDTSLSNQPGSITEDLFNQIIDTIRIES